MKKAKFFAVGLCSALLVASVGAAKPEGELPDETTDSTDVAIEDTEEDTEESVIEDAFLPAEDESVIAEMEFLDEIQDDSDSAETVEDVVSDDEVVEETEEIISDEAQAEEQITVNEIEEVVEETETPIVEETAPELPVNNYDFESVQYASSEIAVTYYLMDAYNVRTTPDPNAPVLTTLDKGTAVSVVGTPIESSPWIKISVDGQVGYINTFYLSADPVDVSADYSAGLKTDTEAEDTYAQWAFN